MKGKIKDLNDKFRLLGKVPTEREGRAIDDKLSYAIKKNITLFDAVCKPHFEKTNEKISEYNRELCATNEDGTLKYDFDPKGNKHFALTKENSDKSAAKTKALNEVYQETVVEFEAYHVDPLAPGNERVFRIFDTFDREILDGLLFDMAAVNKAKEKAEKDATKGE